MNIIKSWFLPALFLFWGCVQFTLAKPIQRHDFLESNIDAVSKSETWKALLHVKNDTPKIIDPKFLLSSPKFNPRDELQLTLVAFVEKTVLSYCRFPARYLFLSKHFELPIIKNEDLTFTKKCKEFDTYLKKVPYEELSLVYASEVLSSASSMMGHVFLKAAGQNDNGRDVSHSISFFTQYDTFNPFKLIYDGLIGGMDGFFMVHPFYNDLKRYSKDEQRNVFEYKIGFENYESKLVMMHIWELKGIEISYLFQSYNCATLTLYLLSLSDPELRNVERLFVSPADVVKAIEQQNLIEEVGVTLASKWSIKLLSQELGSSVSEEVESFLFHPNQVKRINEYIPHQRMLAIEYLQNLLKNKYIQTLVPNSNQKQLKHYLTNFSNRNTEAQVLSVDFRRYKNPIDSQQDSVFGATTLRENKIDYIDLSFLPASHYFRAKNEQFFSESELKIGELVLRINTESLALNIHELTLYSVTSLVPSTNLQPEWSGSFYLGYKQNYNNNLQQNGYVNISGGFGKTYKIQRDIMIYGMFDVGVSLNLENQLLFVQPRIGGIVNLLGNLKLKVEHVFKIDRIANKGVHNSSAEISWSDSINQTLAIDFQSIRTSTLKENTLRLIYNYHY